MVPRRKCMTAPAGLPSPVNLPSTAAMSMGWPSISGARNVIISVKTKVPAKPPIIARGRALTTELGWIERSSMGITHSFGFKNRRGAKPVLLFHEPTVADDERLAGQRVCFRCGKKQCSLGDIRGRRKFAVDRFP